MKKSTEELLKLMKESDNIGDYLDASAGDMIEMRLPEVLADLIEKSGRKPAEVFRRGAIEKSYGYAILSGKRSPERDKLIALMFGLALEPDEAQKVLRSTGYPPLYPKITRDAVILFCMEKGMELSDCNEVLFDMGLKLL